MNTKYCNFTNEFLRNSSKTTFLFILMHSGRVDRIIVVTKKHFRKTSTYCLGAESYKEFNSAVKFDVGTIYNGFMPKYKLLLKTLL